MARPGYLLPITVFTGVQEIAQNLDINAFDIVDTPVSHIAPRGTKGADDMIIGKIQICFRKTNIAIYPVALRHGLV